MTEHRFYREWIPTAEFEVPEIAAVGLAAHARGAFAEDGTLLFVEMYSGSKLSQVEYRRPVESLPGVPFDVRFPAGGLGDLHWSVLRNYDALGGLTGVTVQLLDRTERSWMEVSYDATGRPEGASKFAYDQAGEMRYLLDYDDAGTLVDIYDRAEARNPLFEAVLAELPDRGFYADGRTLPANVSPGPTDFPDEIVRRELARPEPVRSGRDDQGLA
jgi:hypothetical protein